jgi:hypothetical protein
MPKDEIHIKTHWVTNRMAAILKAKQPFLDWLNTHPHAKGLTYTLEGLNQEPHLFLFPLFDLMDDNRGQVELAKPHLFAEMLEAWYRDETTWPKDRAVKVFNEWFDVEISTDITDFGDGEIGRDEN